MKSASVLTNVIRVLVLMILASVMGLIGYNCNTNQSIQENGAPISGKIISFSVVDEGLSVEDNLMGIKTYGQKIDIGNLLGSEPAVIDYKTEEGVQKYVSFAHNSSNSIIGDTVQLRYSKEFSRAVEVDGDYNAPFRLISGFICFFLCIFILQKISEDSYVNKSLKQEGGQRCLRCGAFIKKEKLFCGTCGTWTFEMNPKGYRPVRGANFLILISVIGVFFCIGMFLSGFTFFNLIVELIKSLIKQSKDQDFIIPGPL